MVNGNLDLHRGLSGPTLYTNISVGVGTDALLSGGPKESGPNAVAGTTWWRILSQQPLDPNRSNGTAGSCSYGPSINLVGVDLQADQVGGWGGCGSRVSPNLLSRCSRRCRAPVSGRRLLLVRHQVTRQPLHFMHSLPVANTHRWSGCAIHGGTSGTSTPRPTCTQHSLSGAQRNHHRELFDSPGLHFFQPTE